MKLLRRYLRCRTYPVLRKTLGIGVVMGLVTDVLLLGFDDITPVNLGICALCTMTTLYITAMWRPLMAYYEAIDRAHIAEDMKEESFAVALTLAKEYEVRKALWIAAGSPQESSSTTLALRVAAQEVNHAITLVNSKMVEADQSLAAAKHLYSSLPDTQVITWIRHLLTEQLAEGLAASAVAIAGASGARMRDTWMADLIGAPEEGLAMGRLQRLRHATGFVIAALRMRARTIWAPVWKPLDWLLASESRTRSTTTLMVGAQAITIEAKSGLYVLITEGWGWCGGCAVALTLLFRWLRGVRGVELATAQRPEES
jgi:hypothetical protein